jgi:hypothetical protein
MATRDELYAKFGITAEAAQLFETELGTLLLAVTGIAEHWKDQPDPASARELLDHINDKHTLGRLLGTVSDKVDFDKVTRDKLASAVAARNRLNHGFFLRHGVSIQSGEGREAMVAELEKLHDELFNAWQLASTMSDLALKALHDP